MKPCSETKHSLTKPQFTITNQSDNRCNHHAQRDHSPLSLQFSPPAPATAPTASPVPNLILFPPLCLLSNVINRRGGPTAITTHYPIKKGPWWHGWRRCRGVISWIIRRRRVGVVVGTIMRCGWGRRRRRRWKRDSRVTVIRWWWQSDTTVIIALWSSNSVNRLRWWRRRKRSFTHT